MEIDRRGEHEGEREKQKEEDMALEWEGERHDRQREFKMEREKMDGEPSAENLGYNCLTPSLSNLAISVSNVQEDRCIVLNNVFDGTLEREDIFDLRIRNDFHRNSARCGAVNHMHVDEKCGRVYMLFDSVRSANNAAKKWHQSSYKGNVITISFSDTAEYKERFGAEAEVEDIFPEREVVQEKNRKIKKVRPPLHPLGSLPERWTDLISGTRCFSMPGKIDSFIVSSAWRHQPRIRSFFGCPTPILGEESTSPSRPPIQI